MNSDYLLLDRDYTFYNALAWGNCLGHYRRAFDSQSSCSERIMHSVIALFETIPILSQSASLVEMAISHCFRPPFQEIDVWGEWARRRANEPPEEFYDLIFSLHRKIESQYRELPWPTQMQKIVIMTEVQGGQGDVAAAAKAIALMQKICSTLTFDWALMNSSFCSNDPQSFLHCDYPSNVHIRKCGSEPPEKSPGDFLLTGPVKLGWGLDYIESLISRKIAGPTFGFRENAENPTTPRYLQAMVQEASPKADSEIYQDLHSHLFPSESGNSSGQLPMGLQPGSGVFLDRSRIEAPKSRGYCCSSYLPQIQDAELRKDILEAMNVFDGKSEPDYDQYSFNSGYAHNPASWGKFIDCVAIHEKKKDVVIVLNQRGEFAHPSTKEFQDQIFTPERLAFLREKGYGRVIFKGQGQDPALLQEEEASHEGRRLTVIVRPSFAPEDMKYIQLASERLLATGDNTAVESWCSRCKLYLYEDAANMGCKWRFLQQQVDLAKTISPNLSQLLALFGGDQRLPNRSLNKPLSKEEMVEMEQLLNDSNLSDATLQFCKEITVNYSFHKVLEAALKRAAWHHLIPALATVEAENLGEKFRSGLVTYLKKNPKPPKETFDVPDISALGKRIQETVQKYISSE